MGAGGQGGGRPVVGLWRGGGRPLGDAEHGGRDEAALEGVDAAVNLAGTGIGDKRWTPERKDEVHRAAEYAVELLESFGARATL